MSRGKPTLATTSDLEARVDILTRRLRDLQQKHYSLKRRLERIEWLILDEEPCEGGREN